MKRLAVLISNKGTGTNLQAIINAIESDNLNAQIAAVVSDTEEAQGLEHAKKHNLPIKICPRKEDLLQVLKNLDPDLICLAGWKQIILDEVIDAYTNKILNLHPGLVPDSKNGVVKNPDGTDALWNKGLLTEKAVQNFLDQNATYAGSTVHLLSKEFDFGKVLALAFVKIKKNDTLDSLYQRLKKEENRIYVEALQKLCS